jgi:hypothetical protein
MQVCPQNSDFAFTMPVFFGKKTQLMLTMPVFFGKKTLRRLAIENPYGKEKRYIV